MSDTVIATLKASPARRTLGVATVVFLGGFLLYLAAVAPPAGLGWTFFLLLTAVGALAAGYYMWIGTQHAIELYEDGLFQSDGRVIARFDNIASCDRGLFAFKPSNGFMVRLKEKQDFGWVPGAWWRVGKRVGIGGVTQPAHAKMMADALSAMIAQRDGLGQ